MTNDKTWANPMKVTGKSQCMTVEKAESTKREVCDDVIKELYADLQIKYAELEEKYAALEAKCTELQQRDGQIERLRVEIRTLEKEKVFLEGQIDAYQYCMNCRR